MAIGKTNYGRLRQRQGTVAELASANPVLAYGEFTMTYDGTTPILKIGDGTRTWSELPNLVGGGGGGVSAWTQLTAPQTPSYAATSYSLPTAWTIQGSQGGAVDVTPLDYRVRINTAGWYTFRLAIRQEFTSTAPTQLSARIVSDSAWREYRSSFPVAVGGTGNAAAGCWGDVSTGPVYVPAGDRWWTRMDWWSADTVSAGLQFTLDIAKLG